MQSIARFLFWLFGWKTVGQVPTLPKYVAIFAPHTSTWDFPVAMLAKAIFQLPFSFFGKAELFQPPFGFLFRWLGGIPIDRSSKHNMVEQIIQQFKQRDHLVVAIAPEGTRKYVPRFKTGFDHIAHGAGVPILLTYIDFKKKEVGLGPFFYPTGDIEKDLAEIMNYYRPIKGRHPEKGVR